MTTEDELQELRDYVRKLEERVSKLEKENRDLHESNDRLSREIRKYNNPNTPPSAHPHLKPDVQPRKTHHKRGAPVGHAGATRPWKEPDETRHITANHCPKCDGNQLDLVGTKRNQIEEFPPDILPKIINVIRDVAKCKNCRHTFTARDGQTPTQGRFGVRLMVLVIFLKFIVRGVLRKTAGFLDAGFALKITPSSVNAIIARAAQAAQGDYDGLKQKIREARIVYADETSFSVLGIKWWVWVFRTDADILLVVRHSRGNDVPKEVLGVDFRGIVVCDGWRAYDCLANASIQRCWAHLLRKSAELDESVTGRHFHGKLKGLFKSVVRFNGKPRTELQRVRKYEKLTRDLRKVIGHYSHYEECEEVCNYVGFRLTEWFTCVRLENVEATNNFAEQAIRETVLVRKIIGAFRSMQGVRAYEALASLLATWQLQKKDVNKELYRMLSSELC